MNQLEDSQQTDLTGFPQGLSAPIRPAVPRRTTRGLSSRLALDEMIDVDDKKRTGHTGILRPPGVGPPGRIGAPELSSLMVTLGGVLALYAALTVWLGPEIRRLPPGVIAGDAFHIGDIRITAAQVLILGATAVLVAGLILLLRGKLLFLLLLLSIGI